MLEKTIKLNDIESVKQLLEITSVKEYEITLETDKYIVDAKSLVGILSLDLTKPLLLKADCKLVAEISRQLEPFEVKTMKSRKKEP